MASQPESREWLLDTGLTRLELLFRAIVYPPAEPILIADNDRTYRDAVAVQAGCSGFQETESSAAGLTTSRNPGVQGKFWEMHALLFERPQALHTKDLIRYAGELSLDVERFREELRNQTYSDRVRADFHAGVQNGVYHTPGLYLDGVRYDSEWDRESLLSRLRI